MENNKTINLDKIRTLAILGDINSGKTNLAFNYLNNYEGTKKIYLFGYPKQISDFTLISTWTDVLKIRDGIIFIDEIQRFLKVYDKKANTQFMEFISLIAHKNNTLIFTTQLSQFVTKGIEAFIDCWAIKRIDLSSLKNGCKPKRIIQRLNDIRKNDWYLDLEQNEFYEYSEFNELGQNGIKNFQDQHISKDWR